MLTYEDYLFGTLAENFGIICAKIRERLFNMSETIDTFSKDAWERAKKIYLSTLPTEDERGQVERHFSMITSVTVENNVFTVYTSNNFAAELLRDSYESKLKNCLGLAGVPEPVTIDFKFDVSSRPAIIVPKMPEHPQRTFGENKSAGFFVSTMPLNDEYTFDEFVVGPSNSYVYAAAKGVTQEPGKKGYNPLFIHGGTGLGKTHIMQAIGNEIKKKNPMAAVCYLTAERFMNEYVNALTSHELQQFRDRYRKIDVMLVDDIQFMSQGKQFQEEFFNTFNALHQEGKQIVMTSDVAPKDLPRIESRLISRFEWGMVQEIELPSYETRLAILKKKSETMRPAIPDETLKFIAQNIKTHVRAMEGALAKVNVMMQMNPSTIMTSQMLSHLLKDFIEKEQTQKKLTVGEIQKAVAQKYYVTLDQIVSPERTATLVTPRQLAMYIAKKFTNKSLPEIAKNFGKSHATIIHGVKTINKRLDVEPELRENLISIISSLGLTMEDKVD